MLPTSKNLAARRPALAALLGVLPAQGNFGLDDELQSEFAGFGFGADGQNAAAEAGDPYFAQRQMAAGQTAMIDVNRAAFQNLVGQRNEDVARLSQLQNLAACRAAKAVEHELQLDPNAGQTLKLGIYSFGMQQPLTIGLASGIFMSDSPATTIRTKRVVMNAPGVGFVTVSTLLIANVAVTVGGIEDAFAYSAQSFSNEVDYPTLPPSQKATMSGTYTGFAPAPLFNGQAFAFSVRFSGRSTIAGGA